MTGLLAASDGAQNGSIAAHRSAGICVCERDAIQTSQKRPLQRKRLE
jgi:hypothetical protein